MPQFPSRRLPFLAPTRLEGLESPPIEIPNPAPIEGLMGVASGSQPWRTREELYKSAFSRPQRVEGPVIGSPGEFEATSFDPVGEPSRRAAIDELSQLMNTEEANETADRERYQNILDERQASFTQGFESPQERHGYVREQERRKLELPITQAREQIAGNQRVAQIQGENALDVERERQRGALNVQDRYNNFMQMLQGGQQGGVNPSGSPISGVTLPSSRGGGSVRFDTNAQQVPPALLNAVASAREQMERSRGMLGGVSESSRVLYNQTVASALQSLPVSNAVREVASHIASSDNLRDLDTRSLINNQELISAGFDLSDITPDELAELNRALLIARGIPGN